MKHTLLTAAICALLCVTSCHNNKGYEFPKAPEQVFLTEENMPPIEYFTLEKVDVPIHFDHIFVFDTIYIIVNTLCPKPFIISVYNKKFDFITGYFEKGTGPMELIKPVVTHRNNHLLFWDSNLNAFGRINIDSALVKRNNYIPQKSNTSSMVLANFVYDNDSVVTMANNMFIKGFGVSDVPEFIQLDAKTGEKLKQYPINKKNFPANINYRVMFYDAANEKYIAAWLKFPMISIYDKDFKLQKQYVGPEDNDIELQNKNSMILENGKTFSMFFCDGEQTQHNVLLSNCRIKQNEEECDEEDDDDIDYSSQEIWRFDSLLNFTHRYKPLNVCKEGFDDISFDEQKCDLFVNGFDENGERTLYKCIFEKQ